MNCREFERRLDRPTRIEDDAGALAHLASCASCRELNEIARASLDSAPPPDPLLTAAVMARTSGPACGPAGDLLADLVDGTLRKTEHDLVAFHLEGCTVCAELADTLGWMGRELPALAAMDPGEEFTAAVLEATVPIAVRGPQATRAARWWAALWDRPRFTWEAAYVGALALWLLFGAGFAPLQEVPARALELARSNPVRVMTDTVQPVALGRQVWQASGGRVIQQTQVSSERFAGLGQAWGSFARHGAEALGSAFRGDLSVSAVRLKDMGGDLKRIYHELRRRKPESKPTSQEV